MHAPDPRRHQALSRTYPPPGAAWYMVAVLMVMYVFSFIDRQILGLLVDPIKREFGVSDTQVGLLQGLTFAVFYCTLGIPIGWLADRFSRRWIVACGVFLWSLMATACGLAANFMQLLLARMGVGVGEAALSPSAYSMISDSFPHEKVGRALGVYNMGISIGSGLALILGGLVVNAVSTSGAVYVLPLLGEVRAWQLVFIVTGAPGLLLCLLLFTVREPLRHGLLRSSDARVEHVGFAQTLRFLGERLDFFGVLFVGIGLLSIIGYGYLGWLPVALNRRFDVPIGDIALVAGVLMLLFNASGVFLSGRIADALAARGRRDAAVLVCVFIAVSNTVFGTLTPLMPAPVFAFACFAAFNLTMSAYATLVPLAINRVTPNQMRGQVAAVYLLVNNLIGLGIGPALMPFVSDHLIGDPNMVYLSMAIVTAICGTTGALLLLFVRTRYERRIEEAAAWD